MAIARWAWTSTVYAWRAALPRRLVGRERTFKPSDYDNADDPEEFPELPQIESTPATTVTFPAGPYDTTEPYENPAPTVGGGSPLSVFNGSSPTGTWSLYVVDDLYWEDGAIDGGWALEITAAP